MNQVIVLRALEWGRDARVERWAMLYKEKTPFFGIWGETQSSSNVHSIIPLSKNKSNKIILAFQYFWFSLMSFVFVLRNAKKGDVVVFIDLETILFGWLAAYIRQATIHYDIADPFYLAKPVPFQPFCKWIEKLFMQFVPLVTAPHKKRFLLFFSEIKENMCIVENVPLFKDDVDFSPSKKIDGRIVIGYFGGLEPHCRGLETIAEIVKVNDTFELIVAGDGELRSYFTSIVDECSRISYYGPFDYNDLPKLILNIDIYMAFYSPDKMLHHYATPNKFYEHLFFGKPILTSKTIVQSDFVLKHQTGWCVKDEKGLWEWSNKSEKNRIYIKDYAENARKCWNMYYSDYYVHIDIENKQC